MFVGSSRLLAKYNLPSVVTFDGTTLPISSKLKILHVTLDSNLNFAHFIFQIIQSSNFHIYAIKQARKFLPLSTANSLFISLVLSRLDYCNSFAGSQTIFYANFKASKTTRPRRFFKLIISALPATVLIVCTGYLSPKDASLNYFGSLHAL